MWKKTLLVGLLSGVLSGVLMMGCTGLRRGMVENAYVSSAKPAFSVTVPSLPLRASGSTTAYVTTEDSLNGIAIDTWMAVYGGAETGQSMAIIAQAQVPSLWYWDSNLYRTFSIHQGTAVFGGQLFQACTYIVEGKTDAFSTLASETDPNAVRWITRRFATRTDFNNGKITLEYREPLPQDIETLTNLPQGGNTFLEAFAERAEKAFVFSENKFDSRSVQQAYIKNVRTRYLNTNFWGTMSRYDIVN